jgi:tetratricopeptide (TPR) repeat protein
VAGTQNNIAMVLEQQGKLEEALELYQKSLDTKIRAVGPDHASVADTKYRMASVHRHLGKHGDAQQLFREAASVFAMVYGESHEKTVDALEQASRSSSSQEGCIIS